MPNRMYPSATMPTPTPPMAMGSVPAVHKPDAAGMTKEADDYYIFNWTWY